MKMSLFPPRCRPHRKQASRQWWWSSPAASALPRDARRVLCGGGELGLRGTVWWPGKPAGSTQPPVPHELGKQQQSSIHFSLAGMGGEEEEGGAGVCVAQIGAVYKGRRRPRRRFNGFRFGPSVSFALPRCSYALCSLLEVVFVCAQLWMFGLRCVGVFRFSLLFCTNQHAEQQQPTTVYLTSPTELQHTPPLLRS